MRINLIAVSAISMIAVSYLPAHACDICSIYSGISAVETKEGSVHFGLSEQFSEFKKIQQDGRKVDNPLNQRLSSSITQIYGAYDISDIFALHLTIPIINRRFRTITAGVLERGTEGGLGDISLQGKLTVLDVRANESISRVSVLAGIKLPTGDSDRLAEHGHTDVPSEHLEENHDSHEHHVALRHGDVEHEEMVPVSAIHGHDLALGTGSIDVPLGINGLFQRGRWIVTTGAQYVIRGEGRDEYQFANDLTYFVTPAYFVALGEAFTLAAGAHLSGEWKEKDSTRGGILENDTGISSVFTGPTLTFTARDDLSAELAYDIPLDIENSGTQVIADYRIRAAFHLKF